MSTGGRVGRGSPEYIETFFISSTRTGTGPVHVTLPITVRLPGDAVVIATEVVSTVVMAPAKVIKVIPG